MKYLITLLLATTVFAQDRAGNGGSYSRAQLAIMETRLEKLGEKIHTFFHTYPELKYQIRGFDMEKFVQDSPSIKFEVVTHDVYDQNGDRQSCANMPGAVRCNMTELELMNKDVPAQYVLLFHEMLGATGTVEDFSISTQLLKYVSGDKLTYTRPAPKHSDFVGSYLLYKGSSACPKLLMISEMDKRQAFYVYDGKVKTDWTMGPVTHSRALTLKLMNREYYMTKQDVRLGKDGFMRRYFTDLTSTHEIRDWYKIQKSKPGLHQQMLKVGPNELYFEQIGKFKCQMFRPNTQPVETK